MDIDKIKDIVNNRIKPKETQEQEIIQVIARDQKAIPLMMQLLSAERATKQNLIDDMNLELSRADVHIQNPVLAAREKNATRNNEQLRLDQAREFVLNNITAFYAKYKGVIRHCFNKQI